MKNRLARTPGEAWLSAAVCAIICLRKYAPSNQCALNVGVAPWVLRTALEQVALETEGKGLMMCALERVADALPRALA